MKPRNSTWRRFEGAAMILAGREFECREERRGAVPFKPLSLGVSRTCFGLGVIPLLVFNHDFTYKAKWVLGETFTGTGFAELPAPNSLVPRWLKDSLRVAAFYGGKKVSCPVDDHQ
jgi:hypothetical protein